MFMTTMKMAMDTFRKLYKDNVMTHTISFKTVAEMILWLVDNDIDKLPVDLTIHLGE